MRFSIADQMDSHLCSSAAVRVLFVIRIYRCVVQAESCLCGQMGWIVVVFNVSEQNLRYSWFEHRVSNHSNRTDATSRARTAYPFGKPEFILGFSGVSVARSLALCLCFVDRCLSFCPFSFGHCIVCPSPNYRFLLILWYLQTPLPHNKSCR